MNIIGKTIKDVSMKEKYGSCCLLFNDNTTLRIDAMDGKKLFLWPNDQGERPPLPLRTSYRLRLLLEDVERFRLNAKLPAKHPLHDSNEISEIQNVLAEVEHQNLILKAYDESGWFELLKQCSNWSNDPSSPTPPQDVPIVTETRWRRSVQRPC